MMRLALPFFVMLISLSSVAAQTQSPQTFKAGVTVIQVPVVVRDHDGHVVNNLGKDDFQLFDNGKRLEISSFAVEGSGNQAGPRPVTARCKHLSAATGGRDWNSDSRALRPLLL